MSSCVWAFRILAAGILRPPIRATIPLPLPLSELPVRLPLYSFGIQEATFSTEKRLQRQCRNLLLARPRPHCSYDPATSFVRDPREKKYLEYSSCRLCPVLSSSPESIFRRKSLEDPYARQGRLGSKNPG